MTTITMRADGIEVALSTHGGVITRLDWDMDGMAVPLLRQAPDGADAPSSACYPLVPFGNRVRNNRFEFGGRSYELQPNTARDAHYVHGDGWLSQWMLLDQGETGSELGFAFAGADSTPYAYEARQGFEIRDGGLRMTLSVTNRGRVALPFGLGWHPYFPMTPLTTLQAPASGFWTEAEGWLPGKRAPVPADLDFTAPRRLPERWVNNGLEGWTGTAEICWPERGAGLTLRADPTFRHAFIFVSDADFDPSYKSDSFCFEPMTHLANAHNMADLGGLRALDPGMTLSGSMTLSPHRL